MGEIEAELATAAASAESSPGHGRRVPQGRETGGTRGGTHPETPPGVRRRGNLCPHSRGGAGRPRSMHWPSSRRRNARSEARRDLPRRKLAAGVQRAQQQIKRAFDEIATFEPAVYRPKSVLEFRRLDLSAFPTRQKWLSFGFEQGMALGNSSTNFNRKRSAYVLKRFFCDDLIPIGFESPQEHIGGAHGSQTTLLCLPSQARSRWPASSAPMAPISSTTHGRDDIIFDDLASKERKLYEVALEGGQQGGAHLEHRLSSAPRDGRRTTATAASMADLSRIVRSAPEVKRCLMRRLHEYVVAEDQTIDRGYLDYLTRTSRPRPRRNSSAAMKNAIVRILQSVGVTSNPMPIPRRCYDVPPGAIAGDGPPCRVAFILTKNCGQVPPRRRRGRGGAARCRRPGSLRRTAAAASSATSIADARSSPPGQLGPRHRAAVELRCSSPHAQGKGDAERRAPGAVPVGAGGAGPDLEAGDAHDARIALAAAGCPRSACCTESALAQSSQFKGWAAISQGAVHQDRARRTSRSISTQFLPAESMDDLLGTWSTFGTEHTSATACPMP